MMGFCIDETSPLDGTFYLANSEFADVVRFLRARQPGEPTPCLSPSLPLAEMQGFFLNMKNTEELFPHVVLIARIWCPRGCLCLCDIS